MLTRRQFIKKAVSTAFVFTGALWVPRNGILRPAEAGIAVGVPAGGGVPAAGHTDYTKDANCQGAWLFYDNLLDSGTGSAGANELTDHGTITFATTTLPSGYGGTTSKYIILNGTSQYGSLTYAAMSANFPGKATGTNVAFCTWVRHAATVVAGRNVFGFGGQTWTFGWAYSVDANSNVNTTVTDADQSAYDWNKLDDWGTANVWRHYAFSFAGASPSGTMTYWISASTFGDVANGLTASMTNVSDITDPSGWSSKFSLGASATTTIDSFFNGNIFQPIFLNRQITGTQVAEIFGYGIDGKH